jgi:class 3 adenylate cyclase/AmiR/NasT family two-component response regulator
MSTKMIVVDDEPDLELLVRQRFRKQIERHEYEFIYAANGKQALLMLEENEDVDVILVDIHMPEMDGLSLLVHLNVMNPLVKAVIVSAYGDMSNIRTAMNNGAYDFVTKPIDFDDLQITIEKTIKHVRQLRNTVQSIRENNILKMYVDQSVLNFIAGKKFEENLLTTETLDATIVFIDICGFTRISEKLDPQTVVTILNFCFDYMVKAIITEDGDVDKFMGDAVMAIFKGEGHLSRAVKAALKVRRKTEELQSDSIAGIRLESNFLPRVAIGICSGSVVSGSIGSRTLKRLDYTVIGDVVNTASRFQGIAKPGQVIVGEDVRVRLGSEFSFTKIGPVILKNKEIPLEVYNVVERVRQA